jgi:hypothetical protein
MRHGQIPPCIDIRIIIDMYTILSHILVFWLVYQTLPDIRYHAQDGNRKQNDQVYTLELNNASFRAAMADTLTI